MHLGASTNVIPFKQRRSLRLAQAAHVSPQANFGQGNRVFGVPGRPHGVQISPNIKLANMVQGLSDYINTPGTPGSSTFYLYGLGQDDSMIDTGLSPAASAMAPSADVTPSTSPSFMTSLTNLFQTAAQVAPAVLNTVNQANAASLLSQGKITQAQYQQVMSNPTATFALQPSAGFATGLKIGGGTLALLGIGALALLFLKKR
jgi:hypothetical protein